MFISDKLVRYLLVLVLFIGAFQYGIASPKKKKDSTQTAQKSSRDSAIVSAGTQSASFFGKILHSLSPKEYRDWANKQSMKLRLEHSTLVAEDSKDFPFGSSRKDLKNKHDSIGYKTERQWDTIQKIVFDIPSDTSNSLLNEVVGFHPFWNGRAYLNYNYSLLSRIVYFSYALDPSTGNYTQIHSWKSTGIREKAHSYGCKVDLCVSNFGATNNRKFLKNIAAQNLLIDSLIQLVSQYGGDGVNLDFEGIPGICKKEFTNFVINLSTKFKAVNSEYKISICLPAIDFANAFEIDILQKYVDFFIIMGYDFYGGSSTVAGPNAPLFSGEIWYPYNLEVSVTHYIKEKGLQPDKCILALPYFGKEWTTAKGTVPSSVKRFIKTRTYAEIQGLYEGKYALSFDSVSCSSYYTFHNGDRWVQSWFDDTYSLGIKYDYILSSKLAGVGIWALGFDNGRNELWNLIKQKFAFNGDSTSIKKNNLVYLDSLSQAVGLKNVDQPAIDKFDIMVSLRKFVDIIAISIFILLFFGIVGFILAITDCNVRDLVFKTESAVYLFVLVLLILVAIFLRIYNIMQDKEITFFLGVFLGMFITYIVLRIHKRKASEKDLP